MTTLAERSTDSHSQVPRVARSTDGLRLALADDDRGDQQLLLHAIERAGARADLSLHDDGVWLISHLSKLGLDDLPDLILLDLQMPHLDGFGVLGELQTHPILWQIPVLMLTAAARPGDRERARRRGATYFNVKPTSFGEMVDLAGLLPHLARSMGYASPPSLN